MTEQASPTRAGRPKSAKKQQAIFDAASELFLEKGFQGTSMDAVANTAGVSKQTVYRHYANKEELFKDCIRSKVSSYGFDESKVIVAEDVRTALLAITRSFVELLFDPEVVAMHRVVIGEASTHPRIAALFFECGPKQTKLAVCRFLRQQVDQERLRILPQDILYAATQLLNTSIGSYQLQLLLGLQGSVDSAELDTHLARAVDDFLRLYGC